MKKYLEPTNDTGKKFHQKFQDKGKVVMLNLLKFRPIADYEKVQSLKPETEITGKTAYQLYMKKTLPHLKAAGGRVLFFGKSQYFLIGPQSEQWDAVLLVEYESALKFMEFIKNEAYLKTAGHRNAALADSRLLPISSINI